MSETKWHWDGDGNPWEDYNTKEQAPWIVDDDGLPVLSGEIHCRSESEARLLAAAPEMYWALDSSIIRQLIGEIEDNPSVATAGLWALAVQWMELRDAALAKARGEA